MIQEIELALPRPITTIHQIELTSKCSLRCVYCPSPSIVAGKYPLRPAVDMDLDTLGATLEHVSYFLRRGTQGEINLAGIGESMMREDFILCVEKVREAAPFAKLIMATNGLHLTESIAKDLARLKVRLWVSLHRPEKAGKAVAIAQAAGIIDGVSVDPSINADDWAGQVQWMQSYREPIACEWIRSGWAFVMAHGAVTSCCLDAQGLGVIGSVTGDPGSWKTKPYKLCASCQQVIGVKGHVQHPAPA